MKIELMQTDKWIVFVGGPRHRVLQALIDNNIPVAAVIIPNLDNPKLDVTKEICKRYHLPMMVLSKAQLSEEIPIIKNMPCLSLGFPYLFPESFINQSRFILNVHGTLLPKYRGACTLNWIIENGDMESGITVHLVDAGCDTGDIIYQKTFPLSQFETGKSLYRKTLEFEPSIVIEALKRISAGEILLESQKNRSAVDYPNRRPAHSEIDPAKPLLDLYNKIRAADPIDYPAHFYLNGEKVCIKLWRENKLETESDLI